MILIVLLHDDSYALFAQLALSKMLWQRLRVSYTRLSIVVWLVPAKKNLLLLKIRKRDKIRLYSFYLTSLTHGSSINGNNSLVQQ